MGVVQFLKVSLTVADSARVAGFFRDGLGLDAGLERRIDDPAWLALHGLEVGTVARSTEIVVGGQTIELVAFDPPGAAYPAERASNDQWFQHVALVCGDPDAAARRLRAAGAGEVTAGGPVHLPRNTGSVTAFKFRDPEGHPLELLHFPEGTGAAVWQASSGGEIVGYDHSAIVVADLPRSLAFYEDVLGFHIAGRSLNQGPGQDRLDGLDGCKVDVVALAPSAVAVPHIELLCYRVPKGRRLAEPVRVTDVASVRQVHSVDGIDALAERLLAANHGLISPGVLTLPDGARAASVRDPDGHLLVLVEKLAA